MPEGVGQISKMIASLVAGGGLEQIALKKLQEMGGEFILEQLGVTGTPFGILTDLRKLQPKALKLDQFSPLRVRTDFIRGLQKQVLGKKRGNWRSKSAWGRSEWAKGRDDWLDNHWRHDWRSQPRNALGKWIPGRLPYIPTYLQTKGKTIGRKTKRRRKLRRQARLRGRRMAKRMFRR
jgi:hypothetical protein